MARVIEGIRRSAVADPTFIPYFVGVVPPTSPALAAACVQASMYLDGRCTWAQAERACSALVS